MTVAAEDFFSPVVEQGTLDYRSIPDGPDKQSVQQFFVEHFGYMSDAPVDFVKIDGKYYYKTHWDKRIPLKLVTWIKVISLDNIPFVLPG